MAAIVGIATLGCLLLGAYGYRLARQPGISGSGYTHLGGGVLHSRPERTSLLLRLLNFLDRVIGGRVLGQMSRAQRLKVQEAIARAGSPGGVTVEGLVQRQATWAAIFSVVAVILVLQGSLFAIPLPVVGWLVPRYSLILTARQRQQQMERELPDFLDVLAVTISAGLGFRAALRRVATLLEGPVASEMLVVLRQIDLGASRRKAFEDLRARTTAPSLHNFITAFLQSEELGTPLGGFLETYALELRRTAGQRARTAAARANPKISLILTLIIMPALSLFMIGSLVLMAFVGR